MGDDSANVSRRKHRVSDVPCSRFRRKVGLTVVLRWSYGGLMIQVTEKHLELSTYEGTKNVRETSDMVRVPTENTKDTKIRIPMKLDNKSQQITQITQIIIDKRKSSNETNETNNSCNSCNSLTIKESHRMKQMKQIIRVVRVIR